MKPVDYGHGEGWWTNGRIGLAALACVALAACARPDGPGGLRDSDLEARARLASTSTCCKTLSELPWQPLPAGKTLDVTLDEKSPAFDFDTGRSHFAAYRLPETGKPRDLKIAFYPRLGAGMVRTAVLPQMVLLDERYETVRTTSPSDFVYSAPGWIESAAYNAKLNFDPGRRERFLIIRTTDAYLRRTMPDGIATGYIFLGPPDPDWYRLPMAGRAWFSPVGSFSLRMTE
jgi:hypothetical protein